MNSLREQVAELQASVATTASKVDVSTATLALEDLKDSLFVQLDQAIYNLETAGGQMASQLQQSVLTKIPTTVEGMNERIITAVAAMDIEGMKESVHQKVDQGILLV